jgi:thiol-disulfide isomerase/thioredoxin
MVATRLDGGTAPVAAAGTAQVINFWATWCEPCRDEMPSLQRLSEHFSGSDLAVVGLSVDDDLNLVREFVLRYRIAFPIYVDLNQSLRARFAWPSYPQTILVTREGRVAAIIAGKRDWASKESLEEIERALDLAERAPRG